VSDVAAVVDAAGVQRFPLLGYSQGCAVAIAYAIQHPERVSHLVLLGGFALGTSKRGPEGAERIRALATLMRLDWGADNPALRQMIAVRMMPGASEAQLETFGEWQRKTCSAECAARYLETQGNFDVLGLLPEVRVPTLVVHVRDDVAVPLELGLATRIPGAKFVVLQGKNHIPLEQDLATQRFL
jgi:pimeloyl-ACP methyl ester carboxylesterase